MKILDTFPDPQFDPRPEGQDQQTLVLGGGCFWCTEGVFREIPGVITVKPGYAGGSAETANYRAVSNGNTGHAEVIIITYDSAKISLGQLFKIFFWLAHDPTQKDGQGNDIGDQYRSVIFYANDHQHGVAEQYIQQLDGERIFDAPIATRLEELKDVYLAEDYHHNYASSHANEGYIRAVAQPKIDHTRRVFDQSAKQ